MGGGPRGRRPAALVLAVVVLLFAAATAAGAATPAGTKISNRVQATYTWQGLTRTTWSEESVVTVRHVAGVTLTPASEGTPGEAGFIPAYSIAAPADNRLYIPYRVTNTGNGPDVFSVSGVFVAPPSGPDVVDLAVYYDADGDGVPSSGDTAVDEIALGPGESAALLLALRLPSGAAGGTDYFVRIDAMSKADAAATAPPAWSRLHIENTGAHLFAHRTVAVTPTPAFGAPANKTGVVAGQGAVVTHTVTLTNISLVRAEDARFWEPLPAGEGLRLDTYGPGKPVLFNGTPTPADGSEGVRLVTSPDGIWGLEIDIPRIQPDQRMVVAYEVEVDWTAGGDEFVKRAAVHYETTPGRPETALSNEIVIVRQGEYGVRIGPKGAVLAPGEKGRAVKSPVYYGERVRFPTVVRSTGNLTGSVELAPVPPPPPGWRVDFFEADGVTRLGPGASSETARVGPLPPGAFREIVVEVTVPADPSVAGSAPVEFDVVAASVEDPAVGDETTLVLDDLQAASAVWEPLWLVSDQGPAVTPGQQVTFAVVFGNDTAVDVYEASLVATVNEYVEDVEIVAEEVGSVRWILEQIDRDPRAAWRALGLTPAPGVVDAAAGELRWEFAHLAPDVGGKVVFRGRVPGAAGPGAPVAAHAALASRVPDHRADTGIVRHTVLGQALSVEIASALAHVVVGDVNTYTVTVANLNPAEDFSDVEVWIEPSRGLSYRPGTTSVDGEPVADPTAVGGRLRYVLPTLPKDGRVFIAFEAVADASAEGKVAAGAEAVYVSAAGVKLRSPVAVVRTPVRAGAFGDDGTVLGRVLVDGRPAPGLRVLLDDGRFAVTDDDGRYTLRDVASGWRAVRLDRDALDQWAGAFGVVDAEGIRAERVFVPRAGVALLDFALTARRIVVETEEGPMEGNDR